jgi:hypothetical protein
LGARGRRQHEGGGSKSCERGVNFHGHPLIYSVWQ